MAVIESRNNTLSDTLFRGSGEILGRNGIITQVAITLAPRTSRCVCLLAGTRSAHALLVISLVYINNKPALGASPVNATGWSAQPSVHGGTVAAILFGPYCPLLVAHF